MKMENIKNDFIESQEKRLFEVWAKGFLEGLMGRDWIEELRNKEVLEVLKNEEVINTLRRYPPEFSKGILEALIWRFNNFRNEEEIYKASCLLGSNEVVKILSPYIRENNKESAHEIGFWITDIAFSLLGYKNLFIEAIGEIIGLDPQTAERVLPNLYLSISNLKKLNGSEYYIRQIIGVIPTCSSQYVPQIMHELCEITQLLTEKNYEKGLETIETICQTIKIYEDKIKLELINVFYRLLYTFENTRVVREIAKMFNRMSSKDIKKIIEGKEKYQLINELGTIFLFGKHSEIKDEKSYNDAIRSIRRELK